MEPDPRGVPVLRSSDHPIPPEFAFEVYHDTNAPVIDTYAPDGGRSFRMDVVDYLVDDVVVTRLDTGPHTMHRRAQHLRDGSTDWVTVQIHHTGGLRGSAGRDCSLDLGAHCIGIVDLSQPIAAWSEGGVSTWVSLPRHRVDGVDNLVAISTLERSSLRARTLEAAIGDLWTRLAYARAGEAEQLADEITETVNAVLADDGFIPTDRDLQVAMRDFVKVNLGDLDLDVDTLRATFHCSRATVYRLFETHGGVAAFIRDQRLLRCFDELSRPAKLPRLVSEVATRWGFENPSHFNRLFKAKFGLPPSGIRMPSNDFAHEYVDDATIQTHIHQFHSWAVAG